MEILIVLVTLFITMSYFILTEYQEIVLLNKINKYLKKHLSKDREHSNKSTSTTLLNKKKLIEDIFKHLANILPQDNLIKRNYSNYNIVMNTNRVYVEMSNQVDRLIYQKKERSYIKRRPGIVGINSIRTLKVVVSKLGKIRTGIF